MHEETIREQILNDSQRLLEAFSSFQKGLELISNGLQTSCEINAATIVTFRHHGHFLVLDHCSEFAGANFKAPLENTRYDDPSLFGSLPMYFLTDFYHEKSWKGYLHVHSQEILAKLTPLARS